MSGAATRKRTMGGANSDPALPGDGFALLQSDVRRRLTFVFTAVAHRRVLATIDELPQVWAIGETVPAARAALFVELALLLAANRANSVPLAERYRVLKRETVLLAMRRPS